MCQPEKIQISQSFFQNEKTNVFFNFNDYYITLMGEDFVIMKLNKHIFSLLFMLGAFWFPDLGSAQIKSTENTSVQLYFNGKNDLIAHFQVHNGRHIYWQNPGDIGQPTTVTANTGQAQIHNQSFPKHRLAYDIMNEYYYDDEAYFSIDISGPSDMLLTFDFVECADECKPQQLQFALDDLEIQSPENWANIKARAEATYPQKIRVATDEEKNLLTLKHLGTDKLDFVPATREIVEPDTLKIRHKGSKWQISWQTQENARLRQALILTPQKAYLADIIYTSANGFNSLPYILLLAFLGGMILNAMPCVFPILGLKIFSLLQSAKRRGRWKRAIFYTSGVWGSFMLLTALLVWLKKQGEAIGWGFQLQSPWFVGIMAVIFLLLFLLMMEWVRFPNMANKFIHRLSGLNEFSTGFFAVLIASPCTGPFMGAAVGYAFMRNNAEIFAVFSALALGYALPYALIELYPQTVSKWLPKPGKWMHKIKIILSIPILLTALWLFGVLAVQIHALNQHNQTSDNIWKAYDAKQVETLANAGENVFIDFTAKWCLTCQFNDKVLLQSDNFKRFIKEQNVHLFKADLTENNDIYNSALSTYGRDGIPVYIYYHGANYRILPVFFSVKDLQ